jgi:hypothetical protein
MKENLALFRFAENLRRRPIQVEAPDETLLPVIPGPQPDEGVGATGHSMRWEDDGGPALEIGDSDPGAQMTTGTPPNQSLMPAAGTRT